MVQRQVSVVVRDMEFDYLVYTPTAVTKVWTSMLGMDPTCLYARPENLAQVVCVGGKAANGYTNGTGWHRQYEFCKWFDKKQNERRNESTFNTNKRERN